MTNQITAEKILKAANSIPEAGRFGSKKVFLACVYASGFAQMSYSEFARELINLNVTGQIHLTRADLVTAMNSDLVNLSEISDANATFHFICLP